MPEKLWLQNSKLPAGGSWEAGYPLEDLGSPAAYLASCSSLPLPQSGMKVKGGGGGTVKVAPLKRLGLQRNWH